MSDEQPFADLLAIETVDDHVQCQTTDQHANAGGSVHGGLIATLVDMAMGRAVREVLDDDQRAVTLQLSVTYLNAAKPGALLIARAEVGKKGSNVVLLSAEVVSEDGKDIAEAVGTFTVVDAD